MHFKTKTIKLKSCSDNVTVRRECISVSASGCRPQQAYYCTTTLQLVATPRGGVHRDSNAQAMIVCLSVWLLPAAGLLRHNYSSSRPSAGVSTVTATVR